MGIEFLRRTADALALVKLATVIAWHRRGFARFWAWKSRRVGRPPPAPEIVALIVRMARENPLWSRHRIANELAKLGHDVGKDAVAKYMPCPAGRPPRPPSQTWGTFIRTHAVGTIAIDFFTVPTATFGVLYVFFVLSLERRRVIHVNVTAHPTAEWAAQQIVEAVGPDAGLARLIRDRDRICGAALRGHVRHLPPWPWSRARGPRSSFSAPWVNSFGLSCLNCHGQAASQWDLLCGDVDGGNTHGCTALPLTGTQLAGLRSSDPRCP